jgi:hypothetical protein
MTWSIKQQYVTKLVYQTLSTEWHTIFIDVQHVRFPTAMHRNMLVTWLQLFTCWQRQNEETELIVLMSADGWIAELWQGVHALGTGPIPQVNISKMALMHAVSTRDVWFVPKSHNFRSNYTVSSAVSTWWMLEGTVINFCPSLSLQSAMFVAASTIHVIQLSEPIISFVLSLITLIKTSFFSRKIQHQNHVSRKEKSSHSISPYFDIAINYQFVFGKNGIFCFRIPRVDGD